MPPEQNKSEQSKTDYMQRAESARRNAQAATSPDMREGFLKLALEWERLARLKPDLMPSDRGQWTPPRGLH